MALRCAEVDHTYGDFRDRHEATVWQRLNRILGVLLVAAVWLGIALGLGPPEADQPVFGQRLAALLFTLAEVHGLGLQAAQGVVLTEGYYWDRDDKSRDFAMLLDQAFTASEPK